MPKNSRKTKTCSSLVFLGGRSSMSANGGNFGIGGRGVRGIALANLLDHGVLAALRFQPDFPKRCFILLQILLQQIRKSLGLLRTQENALKILNGHRVGRRLIRRAEQQQKIPKADPHLDAVGIALPVI